jgi:hypothetical protein
LGKSTTINNIILKTDSSAQSISQKRTLLNDTSDSIEHYWEFEPSIMRIKGGVIIKHTHGSVKKHFDYSYKVEDECQRKGYFV